eukprot:39881-Rhodomonas_salina.1
MRAVMSYCCCVTADAARQGGSRFRTMPSVTWYTTMRYVQYWVQPGSTMSDVSTGHTCVAAYATPVPGIA